MFALSFTESFFNFFRIPEKKIFISCKYEMFRVLIFLQSEYFVHLLAIHKFSAFHASKGLLCLSLLYLLL